MISRLLRRWYRSIRLFIGDPNYRGRKAASLSGYIVWSRLSSVGKSNAARLTILVPLIGAFLIFNQTAVSIFTFDSTFLRGIGFNSEDARRSFTVGNMYWLYFGLCFIGVGSFIFSVRCPEEIKAHPYIMNYIAWLDLKDNSVVAKANL